MGENVSSKVGKVTPSLSTVNMSNSGEGGGKQPPSHEQSIHPFAGCCLRPKQGSWRRGGKGAEGVSLTVSKQSFCFPIPSSNPPTSSLCLDSSIMALRIPLPPGQCRGWDGWVGKVGWQGGHACRNIRGAIEPSRTKRLSRDILMTAGRKKAARRGGGKKEGTYLAQR